MNKYPAHAPRLYFNIVLFFFCKSYKTFQAFATLCRAGFLEDAEILARTLFELHLQAQWMEVDPHKNAQLLFDHACVKEYDSYLRLKEFKGSLRIKRLLEMVESKKSSELAEAKDRYDRLHKQFLKSGKTSKKRALIAENWWNDSIYQLAKKLNAEDQYALLYGSQSDLVHTGSKSIVLYLKPTKDGAVANCYATPEKDFWLSASGAAGWFVDILEGVNKAWSLKLDDESKKTIETVAALTKNGHEETLRR